MSYGIPREIIGSSFGVGILIKNEGKLCSNSSAVKRKLINSWSFGLVEAKFKGNGGFNC